MIRRGMFALALLALLAGCSSGDPAKHPAWLRAERARASGDHRRAAEEFTRLLTLRPDAVRAHLELAQLYDEYLDEPFRAAWHYEAYLAAVPDSPEAASLRALARHARRAALDRWLLGEDNPTAAVDGGDPVRLAREVAILRNENRILREALAGYMSAGLPAPEPAVPATAAVPAAEPVQAAAPAAAWRQYAVVSGDTLEKISRKMYGSGRHANLILDANRDTVRSERSLRVGQVLQIPPEPLE